MKNGVSFFVREDCSYAGHFVDSRQNVLYGHDGPDGALLRAYHKLASLICPANND